MLIKEIYLHHSQDVCGGGRGGGGKLFRTFDNKSVGEFIKKTSISSAEHWHLSPYGACCNLQPTQDLKTFIGLGF